MTNLEQLAADEIRRLKKQLEEARATPQFPYRLLLQWHQRKDGYWNADCPCGGALCGVETEHERIGVEAWHFSNVMNSELDEKRNRFNDKHRLAFAPENAEWLKKWWELSARQWKCQREATNYRDSTIVAAEVLPIQDLMRYELFAPLFEDQPYFKRRLAELRKENAENAERAKKQADGA